MKFQAYTVSKYNFDECMKCTVCSVYCPVLQVNPLYPGPKQAGPDGERLRLKDPYFFNYALKYCLNCKRCEVACPSGVDVAGLIQAARIKYGQDKPTLRDRMLASTDLMGTLARPVARVVNGLTGLRVTRAAMEAALQIDHRRVFPKYSGRSFESWLKRQAHAQAAYKDQVAYFHGCYVNYNYPQLGKDLVKVLNALGVGVQLLDGEKCCGIAYITNGMSDLARKNAVHNVAALEEAVHGRGLKVLTTSSTCSLTLRDEYPALLRVDNTGVRASILIASRYIYASPTTPPATWRSWAGACSRSACCAASRAWSSRSWTRRAAASPARTGSRKRTTKPPRPSARSSSSRSAPWIPRWWPATARPASGRSK